MKKILTGAAVFATAFVVLLLTNGTTFDVVLPIQPDDQISSLAQPTSLKIHQAHLRTIDPFDIDIIPASRPVPEGFPLGSVFGMRVHPILHVEKMHTGIDFPAPSGTPVLATATGKVGKCINGSDQSGYGKYIVLEHDEIYCTLYAHLSKMHVALGDIVEEGDTIGFVGSTGRSTNPHLHYEVIRDGVRVNPKHYF
ncbi:MAG: M23 family metallopeptidase [Bacteroidota bacterium]